MSGIFRLSPNLSRLRGGWFVGPEEYESMGYTLGLPPGFYCPNNPEIRALSKKLRSQNGIILPSMIQRSNTAQQNKKVIISNLPPGISEETIKDRIMKAFQEEKTPLASNPPFERIQIDDSGTFAFIDFYSRKDAEAAVSLGHNVQVEGRDLPISWNSVQLLQTTSSSVPIQTLKTFKPDMSDALIIESDEPLPSVEDITTFLTLASSDDTVHRLEPASVQKCEGFNVAIVVLKDPSKSDYAAWRFHECKIFDVDCRIHRCFRRDGDGPAGLDRNEKFKMSATAGPSNMYTVVSPLLRDHPSIADILNTDIQVAVTVHPETESIFDPSLSEYNHLLIYNVAPETSMIDESFYTEVLTEMREECSKYGKVLDVSVQIPPNQAHKCGYEVINVEFEDGKSAKNAQLQISGRRYRGRLVITQLSEN